MAKYIYLSDLFEDNTRINEIDFKWKASICVAPSHERHHYFVSFDCIYSNFLPAPIGARDENVKTANFAKSHPEELKNVVNGIRNVIESKIRAHGYDSMINVPRCYSFSSLNEAKKFFEKHSVLDIDINVLFNEALKEIPQSEVSKCKEDVKASEFK